MPPRERKPRLLDQRRLREYALKMLGGRAHSIAELREKLRRKAESPSDVPALLDDLKQAGYLDDRAFASSFAAARRENQGFGKGRVLRDLAARRVAPAVAQKAVGDAYASTEEPVLIEQFLARKFRGKDLPSYLSQEKNLASAYRKLRLAGFSSGNTIRALKRYADQAEQLDGLEEGDEPAR